MCAGMAISERRACWLMDVAHSTGRRGVEETEANRRLQARIVALAQEILYWAAVSMRGLGAAFPQQCKNLRYTIGEPHYSLVIRSRSGRYKQAKRN